MKVVTTGTKNTFEHLNQMAALRQRHQHSGVRTPRVLTIHQRRKYLSSLSNFSSSGAKKPRHRPACSHEVQCVHSRRNHGVEETGNYL